MPSTNTSFHSSLITVHASLPPLFSSISYSHTPPPRYSMTLAPPPRCSPLSLYPSPRASFASNTHMHVYRSISQHIPRSTLTIPPHRSMYLTRYLSSLSDKGRLIFLCSYVCLPQPYRPPSSFVHGSRPISHTHVHRQAAIPSLIDIAGVPSGCLTSLSHHLLEATPLPPPPTL